MNWNFMFTDMVEYDNYFYFFDWSIKCICKVTKEFKSLEIVARLYSDDNMVVWDIIHVWDKKFFMVILGESSILSYDIEKKDFIIHKNPYQDKTAKHKNFGSYYKGVRLNDTNILLISQDISKDCYIFDMSDASFSIQKPIADCMDLNENILSVPRFFINKNQICLPIRCTNKFILYDIDTCNKEVHKLSDDIKLISGVYHKDKIYFILYDKKAIFDYENNEIIYLDEEDYIFEAPFSRGVSIDNYIILLPSKENHIYIYDTETKNINKIKVADEVGKKGDISLVINYFIFNNKLELLPTRLWNIAELTVPDFKLNFVELDLSFSQHIELFSVSFCKETDECNLEEFLKGIIKVKNKNANDYNEKSVGMKIYNYLK